MEKLDSPKLSDVKIEDRFWSRYIKLVREKMLPYQWEVLNDRVNDAAKSHCIENFKIAAKESTGKYYGMVFQDTDVAKWLEALAYSLEGEKNGELEKEADEVIDLIGRAQQQDGYLDTYYTIQEPLGRWSNLREGHELYTAGHMIEAAAAYYQATGKDSFLKIVCRLADCICDTFGPDEGKIHGCPGHPEIELALVKLYRLTKDEKYLNMAKYFLDIRVPATLRKSRRWTGSITFFLSLSIWDIIIYRRISRYGSRRRRTDMQSGLYICIQLWLMWDTNAEMSLYWMPAEYYLIILPARRCLSPAV